MNQCSKFGEFLDVLADNIARTILWMCLWKQLSGVCMIFSVFPVCLEWTCFVASHTIEECNWKDLPHNKVPPPYIIRKVFENGFKNIWGTLAVSGLFLLPLYLYMSSFGLMEDIPFMLIILICCRVFCAIAECWIVMNHIRTMIVLDTKGTK